MGDVIRIKDLRSNSGSCSEAWPANDLFAPGGFLGAVNAVPVTGAHLARAIDTIRHIAVRSPADVAEHGRRLAAFAHEHRMGDYGGPALHARAIALDRWAAVHDPFGDTDINGFYAAGATAPLVETDEGLGFDPGSFAEQIDKWTQIFA